ncbi:MAG: branched-chain amino acid ABC transporter permease [Deltaproteobacteria bacterium]|nr:branched-chain amino acid ABC transporter permease [Deltaproteobacteria bacterium]
MIFSFSLIFQSIIGGLLMGGVLSLVAIGLSLIFGVMNIINFAHGALMMVGMYISFFAFQFLGFDPFLSIVFSLPIMFLLGAIIQKILIGPVLNAAHINQLLLTLGLMLFIENMAAQIFGLTDRSILTGYSTSTISLWGASISTIRLMASVLALAINSVLYLFLKKTITGRAIRAASEEKYAAQLVGINVNRINVIAFGIGSACAGAAGSIVLSFYPVSPHVGHIFLIAAFVVIMLGGGSNLMGVFWAALIIGLAESLGQVLLMLPASSAQVVSFGILIIILFFKPAGLFGVVKQ